MTIRNIRGYLNCKKYNNFTITDVVLVEKVRINMLDFNLVKIYYNIIIIYRQDAR